MKRREFITLLGGATAWPLAARAQQGEQVRRVAILMGSAETVLDQTNLTAFVARLNELGWKIAAPTAIPTERLCQLALFL